MATVTTGNGKGKGKGHRAGEMPPQDVSGPIADKTAVQMPVRLITLEDGFNARQEIEDIEELASTIKRSGWCSPVLLRKRANGTYRLISGYRRFFAMSLPSEKGGLGKDTIPATVLDGLVGEDHEADDRYLNLIENVQRDNLSPFDLGMRCLEMIKHEAQIKEHGAAARVSNRIGKSASYVGNLVRVIDRCAPFVLDEWREEIKVRKAREKNAKAFPKFRAIMHCTTDNLVKWSPLTHESQEITLRKLLGLPTTTEQIATAEQAEKEAAIARGQTPSAGARSSSDTVKIAGKQSLKNALAAAQLRLAKPKNSDDHARCEGVVRALEFALGMSSTIKGYYVPEEPTVAE